MPETKKDFFISYRDSVAFDKKWAEWIAWTLEEAKYSVVIQAWDFKPGFNFIAAMDRALRECKKTVAVLTPDYFRSDYTESEWTASYAIALAKHPGMLLPVRVVTFDVEGLLGPISYIDLASKQNEIAAKNALLSGIKSERRKPETKPHFPGGRLFPKRRAFPGSESEDKLFPAIWNVPIPKNHNFTGRIEELQAIHEALAAGKATALTQAALHGLGGVGKTQTAAEYAHRQASEYSLVWWVKAEDGPTLNSDFAALGEKLGFEQTLLQNQPETVKVVREWLCCNDGWLLIFDNVPKPEDIRPLLPSGNCGHVLITSRHSAWSGTAEAVEILSLPEADAIAFLLRRTRQTDDQAAREIARELGGLPLALEQAGAYIEQTGITLAAYLELFKRERIKLFGEVAATAIDHRETVLTTWMMAIEKVGEQKPAAVELLTLCAFLAPDDIPVWLIREGKEFLTDDLAKTAEDDLLWNRAIADLRGYSLIDLRGDGIYVHRLVQAVIRERLTEDDQKIWAERAVETVNEVWPYVEDGYGLEHWPRFARLVPQTLAVAEQAEERKLVMKNFGRLLSDTGFYLENRADYSQAKALHKRAIKADEAAYGPAHLSVARDVNNLGMVLQDLGDWEGAKEHYERALKIFEKELGENDPNVATLVNNLGTVLRARGDREGAKKHCERALKIDEATYEPDHPNVARDVNNLGTVLQDLGDLEGAKQCFERALKIGEATYGPDHPKIAIRVNNLGSVLLEQKDYKGARECAKRAYEIARSKFGDDHPTTQLYLKNLNSVPPDEG